MNLDHFPTSHAAGRTSGKALRAALIAALAVGLIGCSTPPRPVEEAKPLTPAVEPIGEYMSRAQTLSASEGGREQARQIYRAAAKAYPADKRPWLRLAQSYFDARDYGNAVLAAEEVVQRDASDTTAQSLLAVSGLRISTTALSTLRNPNHMNASSRQEAEEMAQSLRTILGEPVLVPTVAEPEPPRPKVAPKPRPKPRATLGAPSTAPAATTKPAAPASPFGALN